MLSFPLDLHPQPDGTVPYPLFSSAQLQTWDSVGKDALPLRRVSVVERGNILFYSGGIFHRFPEIMIKSPFVFCSTLYSISIDVT